MSTIERPREPQDLPGRGEDALAYIAAQLLYRHRITETPDPGAALAAMDWNKDGTYSVSSVLLFMLKSGLKLREIGPFDGDRFMDADLPEARRMIEEYYGLFNSKAWEEFAASWTDEEISEEQAKTRSRSSLFEPYRKSGQLIEELRLPTADDIFSLIREECDVIFYIHNADNVEEIGATPFMVFGFDEKDRYFSSYYPPSKMGTVADDFSTNVTGSTLFPYGILGVTR